jgi:anti-anti-sigma regulatory factor
MITTKSNNKLSYRYSQSQPPMDMDISQVQARVPVAILRLNERINLSNTEQLVEKAQEIFANGMRFLLIDLTNVPSMTSAGLRAIQTIYKIFGSEPSSDIKDSTGEKMEGSFQKSAHLKLLNPNPDLRRILNLVGFDNYIEIHDDQQKALLAF